MISTQIRKANTLLRTKQYQQSLKQYQVCLRISSHEPILNSISNSLLGYNHYCLLNYQQAERYYNKALQFNQFDSTTLFRRATLFLKTKEYEKAAFDISRLSQLQPETMRVEVLIMQIKQKLGSAWKSQNQKDPLKIEQRKDNSNSTSQQQIELGEEEALNFSNLKKIDRVSLKQIKINGKRNSQINFGADQMIEYQQSESQQMGDSKLEKYEEFSKQKQELEELQLNSIQSDEPSAIKFVISKNMKKPKKSILKCSIAYRIPEQSEIDTIKTAPPINVSRVKDIDGKKLESSKFIRFSAHAGKSQILQPNPNSKPRKSCMKNTSMIVNANSIMLANQKRTSHSNSRLSFGQLRNLQGKIIFQMKNSKIDSSGDQSDEYNIFGNKGEKQLHQQLLKIKSFVGSRDEQFSAIEQSKVLKPKKSILKLKNVSIIQKDKSQVQSSINKKKSVIFK